MNIVKNIQQFNEDYVFFCEPIKNNILLEGKFIKILYSTPNFILNGIYIYMILNDIQVEKYYNKYKCIFNIQLNKKTIEYLQQIEENILSKMVIPGKIPTYKIYDQLKNGHIKIYNDTLDEQQPTQYFLLKISGIWEMESNYGITFKFSKIKPPISIHQPYKSIK